MMLSLIVLSLELAAVAPTNADQKHEAANREFIKKNYPPRARAAGEEGLVGFDVTIDGKGRPVACQVTSTSGFPRLDRETCEVVLYKSRFKAARDENGRRVTSRTSGSIAWVMPNRDLLRADRSKQIRTAAVDDGEELTCKYNSRMGSNFVKTKLCLTKTEWGRAQDMSRDEVKRMTATWMNGE
nr:energy transducer TonB [uncultured Sphingomonas sp.]